MLVLLGPAQTLPESLQGHFLSACGLMDGGQIHLCLSYWINPKNRDLGDLNSSCFFDLVLAD